ncbi:MAG TPA: hypothetical protein VIM58_13180 [Candidatus Methylacidiphilales bacterium]
MHAVDWLLFVLPVLLVLGVGLGTQRYMGSVANFLSGGRLAGRYLLAVARGEMQAGAVTFVAAFEVISKSGLTLTWWSWISNPFWVVVGISGFVIYRYRETRAMTLAQFFEIRYSKGFRVFTGILGCVAGVVNFGIIPAVGARFFVYFLGLPLDVPILGHAVPTYVVLMGLFLSVSLSITLLGGMVTLMVTNCIEGILSQLFYLVIIAALLALFQWREVGDVLTARPAGHSLVNPFDSMGLKDFNLWYVLMGMFLNLYGTMAWQYGGSYGSAALSAHEGRMGGILASWRGMGKAAVVTLLGLCAMTYLQHPDFASASAPARAEIAAIGDAKVQSQMEIPVALAHLLPEGVKGALCAVLLMGLFSGDSTHLHTWGGIFVQDVLVPLRRKPFSPRAHILALRLAVAGVALFAFLFGCLFRQTEYIYMWWSLTGALYVGGAGVAIIGGLYWKKGTAAGAWAALLTGSALSVGGILVRQVYGDRFPLNGMEISFYASLIAVALYVGVSLLTRKEDFNMDRMLHRGIYAVPEPGAAAGATSAPAGEPVTWGKLIGLDSAFSRGDRWIATGLFSWNLLWFVVFAAGCLWNLLAPWPVSAWLAFWHVAAVGLPVVITVVTAVWFTWGGVKDIRSLFALLRVQKVDVRDDGTVSGHRNLNEVK